MKERYGHKIPHGMCALWGSIPRERCDEPALTTIVNDGCEQVYQLGDSTA